MSTDEVRATYDTVAASYAETIPGLSAESPLELAFLERFADELAASGGLVADVGCGPGRVTDYLAGRGVDAYGIDLSPEMIATATSAYPALRFDVGSMPALQIADGALAGLLAWYSTIHFPLADLPAVYADFARVLAPGGSLLLGFHVGVGEIRVTNSYGHDVDVSVQLFDAPQLEAMLGEAGFTVEASLVRAPVGRERRPQGFLLARH
jgi:SAM-dependent methyltransferase